MHLVSTEVPAIRIVLAMKIHVNVPTMMPIVKTQTKSMTTPMRRMRKTSEPNKIVRLVGIERDKTPRIEKFTIFASQKSGCNFHFSHIRSNILLGVAIFAFTPAFSEKWLGIGTVACKSIFVLACNNAAMPSAIVSGGISPPCFSKTRLICPDESLSTKHR
jgi:hypothetical protein